LGRGQGIRYWPQPRRTRLRRDDPAQVVTTELLHFAKRNLFWHPYDAKLYDGLKGALQLLHGRAWDERLRGLFRFAALLPRMFRD
jgi:hypothetical protein